MLPGKRALREKANSEAAPKPNTLPTRPHMTSEKYKTKHMYQSAKSVQRWTNLDRD